MTNATGDPAGPTAHDDAYEVLVRILAAKLALPIDPEWVTGIAQQLATSLAMADLLESVDLTEDAPPAPVFTP
jgi:hypothetical protein